MNKEEGRKVRQQNHKADPSADGIVGIVEAVKQNISKFDDEALHVLMMVLSSRVIVPNWFTKEQAERLARGKLTDDEFQRLRSAVEHSSLADEISEFVFDLVNEIKRPREEAISYGW